MNKEEWLKQKAEIVSSTEISMLLGCNKRKSKFTLWHEKKNKMIDDTPLNESMERGLHFEPSIAEWVAKKEGLLIEPMAFITLYPQERIGSSFDYKIVGTTENSPHKDMFQELGVGILEIKKVRYGIFKDEWSDTTAPFQYEAQLHYQMMVSGLKWGIIGAEVGGESTEIYVRQRNNSICETMRKAVTDFYDSIDRNIEPPIDYAMDADMLKKLNHDGSGDVFDAKQSNMIKDHVLEYDRLTKLIKELETKKEELKNQVLHEVGNASSILGDGFKVTTSNTKDGEDKTMTVTAEDVGKTIILSKGRKGYRQFKVTVKEE